MRLLFKDEVRELGKELGLPDELIWRQPFPGVRASPFASSATSPRKNRDSSGRRRDFQGGDQKRVFSPGISQYFAVLTDMRSVGVMGDGRTYDYTLALRGVTTTDFMTADWARIPYDVLDRVSVRIINEVRSINRIVYDITSKPPATIEWE